MEQSQRARKKNKRTGKGTENRLQRLYETLLPENLGKHCREWPAGKTESEIKLLIQENSKPQDLIGLYTDCSVTSQVGALLSIKVRPPSMNTVQPIQSQPPA